MIAYNTAVDIPFEVLEAFDQSLDKTYTLLGFEEYEPYSAATYDQGNLVEPEEGGFVVLETRAVRETDTEAGFVRIIPWGECEKVLGTLMFGAIQKFAMNWRG